MPFDSEHVAKAVQAHLQSALASALDVVELAWADADPVELPDVVTWFYGHKPTVLELASTAFPFMAVIPTGRTPSRARYGWGWQDTNHTLYVDWFVVAADETTVDKLCSRYGEAMVQVFQQQRAFYGYDQVDYEPRVELSEASRHAQTPAANMFDDAQVDFIKMGRATLEFGNG